VQVVGSFQQSSVTKALATFWIAKRYIQTPTQSSQGAEVVELAVVFLSMLARYG
jgi:hypothetical protein